MAKDISFATSFKHGITFSFWQALHNSTITGAMATTAQILNTLHRHYQSQNSYFDLVG